MTDGAAATRFTYPFLFLLIAVAAFIRVHDANFFYYSADEAMHTGIAGAASLAQVLAFSHFEIHPPLLYILAHYWMMISVDPAFVRALPLLFGLLLIPLYFMIGRLLAGEFAGLNCAALIAFSHGGIIQSYVVRQYIVFLFFMSLALYCYLLWHRKPAMATLAGYGFFGVLACLSHFSGIFDIICIGGFETIRQLQKPGRWLVFWLILNTTVGLLALHVYHLWQPILVPLKSYFVAYVISPSQLFEKVFAYPLAACSYFFPAHSYVVTGILLFGLVIYFFKKNVVINHGVSLRFLIGLGFTGLVFGMLLLATGVYPQAATRRSLWLLPLIAPATGWMLALAIRWAFTKLLPSSGLHLQIGALVLLTTGCLLYDKQGRFDDGSEYVWHQDIWNQFDAYLATLSPRDLIIAEKDDGIMLANLYNDMGNDAFTGRAMAKLAPYRQTYILFNPYYPRNYSTDVFLTTLAQARDHHLLDNADRLVFMRMAWSRSPLTDLMLCSKLDRQIVSFPDFHEPLTRNDIERALAVVMIIKPQTLLDQILPAGGSAHGCLNGEHDMVPGFVHGTP